MLTFFLRCPLSIFDVFVINIIIIMILAHIPIKSLVALKRIETQGLGTPGESLVSLRVRFMSRCQFLIMSLAFNLETVNHKNYTVSFFWSKFVQRCWRERGRGDGHLAFPLAKGASPDVFSCPGQLNRWPCQSLTDKLTFEFGILRALVDTSRH